MLIGIDLGTSTCKIIAVDPDGKVVAVASRDYPMINLRPGWAEQEPATKEPLWLQLLADVLGREVVTVTGASEGGAYGATLAAGVGAKVWPDLPAALGRVRVERTFTPDPVAQERYDVVFAAHRRLHEALTDVYALVAGAEA